MKIGEERREGREMSISNVLRVLRVRVIQAFVRCVAHILDGVVPAAASVLSHQ